MSAGLWEGMHLLDTALSPDTGEEYHGPHVEMRRAVCEPIEWRTVQGPPAVVRVLTHTCECRATTYELCGLGGGYFIRRTTRGPSGDRVEESPMLNAGRAGRLWFELLRGRAR